MSFIQKQNMHFHKHTHTHSFHTVYNNKIILSLYECACVLKCMFDFWMNEFYLMLEWGFIATIQCIGHSIHTNSRLQETRIRQGEKASQSVIFGLVPPMHYHPQSSWNKSSICTHMHSMNHKLNNEHFWTHIGIHSPPNTEILISELKYYFILLSSLYIGNANIWTRSETMLNESIENKQSFCGYFKCNFDIGMNVYMFNIYILARALYIISADEPINWSRGSTYNCNGLPLWTPWYINTGLYIYLHVHS